METIRFSDTLAAEWIKITTLPAPWIALTIAFSANTLLGIIATTDAVRIAGQGGPIPIARLGTPMLAPVYAFIAIAVFAAGSEYRGGQLRVSLAAVPDRNRLFAAKLTVSTALSLIASIPAVLPGYVLQHAAAVRAGELRAGDVVVGFLALPAAYLLLGLIGHGFAVIAKTVIAPLTVLLITPVLISPAFQSTLPHMVKFLPHEAALSLLRMPAAPATALAPVTGLLILAAWAALSVATAWKVFVHRDS
jgi:ABC-2 type transport system permease protein